MKIQDHSVWKNVSPFKKPAHLLRIFAARKYASFFPRSKFIGITGSVGKTSTTKACQAVLSQKYQILATEENLDPIFNIPITLLKTRPKTDKVFLEMGVEYPGEMEFYLSLVKPATAIITRIFYSHSEFLGDLDKIIEEKSLLIKQLPEDGHAILNWDDPYTRKLVKLTKANVIFYGFDSKNCHVWASNVKIKNYQTYFELNYGVERVEVTLNLLGRHLVYPCLAAASLGLSMGMSLVSIKKGLETLQPAHHRLQILEGLNGTYVLDDTYNSSPAALEEAINVLNEVPAKRRIAVLGEMRELGQYSKLMHEQIAQKIYKDKVDLVLLGGGETKFVAEELLSLGFPQERLEVNLSNSQLVSKILRVASKGDVILVKASRAVKLDEVVKRISKNQTVR